MAARTSVNTPYQPRPLNFLLEFNNACETMVATDSTLRDIEIIEVIKMLTCGKPALGGIERHCESKECIHSNNTWFTCSSRACSRCGKKSTDNWIVQQIERMPPCPWMHMTFTFPDV